MSTPKQIKPLRRHRDRRFDKPWPVKGAGYHQTVTDHDYLVLIGKSVVTFSALEKEIGNLFGTLIGTGGIMTGTVIMDCIISNSARLQLARRVLQECAQNLHMPRQIDDILDEFSLLNSRRNRIIHGIWHTDLKDSKHVRLSKSDGENLEIVFSDKVELSYLSDFILDTTKLTKKTLDAWVSALAQQQGR